MLRRAFSLTVLLFGSACSEEKIEPVPTPQSIAEDVRELELLRDVPVEYVSREAWSERAKANVDAMEDEELVALTETWGRLGFWSADVDLRAVYAASSDWVGGSYSDGEEKITVVGDASDAVLIHEHVHALQDQHFDLGAYKRLDTLDQRLARRAVVEGDAQLATDRYRAQLQGLELSDIDWAGYLPKLFAWSRKFLAEAEIPVFFLAYPSFAYQYGETYCARNLLGVTVDDPEPATPGPYDWSLEDELFEVRPPPSTLAVLTLDAMSEVREVGLNDVPGSFAGAYERYDSNRLGTWYTYVLLFPIEHLLGEDVLALAMQWRGDSVLFLTHLATEERSVVWASQWASAEDASRIANALQRLHGFEPDGEDPRRGVAADGEHVWLEHAGDDVVFIKNMSDADAAAFAAEALSGSAPRSSGPLPHPMLRTLVKLERTH